MGQLIGIGIRNNNPNIAAWWDGAGWNVTDADHSSGLGWIYASTATETSPPAGAAW